jgi:4-hydroxythreonine-4-phosphate dehydrogenase
MNTRIAFSLGDFNGIGPETILRSVVSKEISNHISFVLCAPKRVLQWHCDLLGIQNPFSVFGDYEFETAYKSGNLPRFALLNLKNLPVDIEFRPGQIRSDAGEIAMASVHAALQLCQHGVCDALVTAPISKESISLAGYPDPGHTEYLSRKCANSKYLMMLVAGRLRVALVTTHLPVREVADAITQQVIIEKLTILNESLKSDFAIESPRITVLGLNPHAGDGGVLGTEEIEIITPAILAARELGINCSGPSPADGWFGSKSYQYFDAVLAMYHDQGLAPFKALSFGNGVNLTAGLPVVRTSPDHGTAFSIAGKGLAGLDSMLSAINLADEISLNRRK